MFAAILLDSRKARAYFHALDGIDAHHRAGDIGIQAIKDRLAQARA